MSDLSPVFHLNKLQAMSADMPLTYHLLSDTTRLLCLDWLTRWPSQRWAWRNNGETLTNEEWDEAQAMVDLAAKELITPMLTGMIIQWSLDFLPDGFEWCDGGEVSRDSDLGGLLVNAGCPYGVGDGTTTVNKPDLRGNVAVGLDSGQSEFDTLGETGGEKTHTLTDDEMPYHTHTEGTAVLDVVNGGLEAPAPVGLPSASVTGGAGSGQAHNNLQPYLTLNFIIKT